MRSWLKKGLPCLDFLGPDHHEIAGSIRKYSALGQSRCDVNHRGPVTASANLPLNRIFARMAKILIADDSKVHVHLLTGWLQDCGFQVLSTFDTVQAWMNTIRSQPDLIVLDINMPGGSGIDVLKRLKVSTKTNHIPVVVITGSGGPEMRDFVLRLGAADLLEKPLDHDRFCGVVKELVRHP